MRDAVTRGIFYESELQHRPMKAIFDTTVHVGTSVLYTPYLQYNMSTEKEDRQQDIFHVSLTDQGNITSGTLEIVWTPLPEPGKKVLSVNDPSELVGKPWQYRVEITAATGLHVSCSSAYIQARKVSRRAL